MDGVGVDYDEVIIESDSGIGTPPSKWVAKLNSEA